MTINKEKIAVFDTKSYEKPYYIGAEAVDFEFFEVRLSRQTIDLCRGFKKVLCFVNDSLDAESLTRMAELGVQYVGLRCAGFNNVDVVAAERLNIRITRVPGYSPQSVAEFSLLQILCLARKLHRALNRTRELNFSLQGLVGQTLFHKTVGVVGVGQIGKSLIELLDGFNCRVLAFDKNADLSLQTGRSLEYVDLETLLRESDFISLHVPLDASTFHLINEKTLALVKSTASIINTGRGGLIDTMALIHALKARTIAGAALDVYEEEENYFAKDFSDQGIEDDELARLISFPNVIVTSHQAYLTELSLYEISQQTLANLQEFIEGRELTNEVRRG